MLIIIQFLISSPFPPALLGSHLSIKKIYGRPSSGEEKSHDPNDGLPPDGATINLVAY